MRITVACPVGMADDANDFAMVMAFGPDDAMTYSPPEYQDGNGARYYAASFEARPEWVQAAQSSLSRPAWDIDQIIDMNAASRAQAALVFWVPDGETPPPQASTAALTAIGGMGGTDALSAMGLTRIEVEE